VDADVARYGPFFGLVERGNGRAIAFLHHLAQMVEVERRDVLDARVDIIDRRRGPFAQPQLEDGLHRDLRRPCEHRGEAFVLRVGPKAFEAETSTAMIRSAPRMRAVPTGRLSTVAPSM